MLNIFGGGCGGNNGNDVDVNRNRGNGNGNVNGDSGMGTTKKKTITTTYSRKRPLQVIKEPTTPQRIADGPSKEEKRISFYRRKSELVKAPRRLSLLPPSVSQFKKLLSLTAKRTEEPFGAFLDANIVGDEILKIGESSFCEAFRTGNLVWKVMPLLRPCDDDNIDAFTGGDTSTGGDAFDNDNNNGYSTIRTNRKEKEITHLPEPVEIEHLIHEIETLKALEGLAHQRRFAIPQNHTGFNHLISCHVVSGAYPSTMVDEWNGWSGSTQNSPPTHYEEDDLHVVLVQEYGGTDLESFPITSVLTIRSILLQLLCSLMLGEREREFEHRDLHPGNVLVEECKRPSLHLPDHTSIALDGVICRIIDCSMSRFSLGGRPFYRDLEGDDWLFKGSSLISKQYDVYREMRGMVGADWSAHHGGTNLLWMEYLKTFMLGKLSSTTRASATTTTQRRTIKYKKGSVEHNILKEIRAFKFSSFKTVGDCYQKAKIAFNKS